MRTSNPPAADRSRGRQPVSPFRLLFLLVLVLGLALAAGCDQSDGQPTPTASTGTNVLTPAATTLATTALATSTLPPATQVVTGGVAGGETFQNPILRRDFADPFVLKEGDNYFAYATNATGANVQVARSANLVKWQVLTDAMPAAGSWTKLGGSLIWAPEVMKIADKYLLYYTARDQASNKQCVGVAVADKPEGKYRDSNDKPFVCQAEEGGTIDASPFRDGDKLYLYFKNDGNCCGIATYLYVQELAPDGLSLIGEPVRLVHNDRAWEGRVVEAPTMWKHEDKYYLFFSANNYAGFEYSVGYANCQTAVGPCEDAPENPILASRMTEKPLVIGPGHQTIIEDDDEETWLVYHVWEVTSAGTRGSSRFMWMDPLDWKDGKPIVNGPTTGPQPLP